jgi:hypothetical protein
LFFFYRNCGNVFCYKCSNQYFPLPNQNLITPVRVCVLCKPAVEQLNLVASLNNNNNNIENTTINNNNNSNKNFVFNRSYHHLQYQHIIHNPLNPLKN